MFHLKVEMGRLIDAPLVRPSVWSPLFLIDSYQPDLPGDMQVQTRWRANRSTSPARSDYWTFEVEKLEFSFYGL